jgi:predicted nicotinamide N-methyase
MSLPLISQAYSFTTQQVQLFVPEPYALKAWYSNQKEKDEHTPFPYWAKVWPAAIAMSEFIDANQNLVAGKSVIELAAGLGLPSLTSAAAAKTVICSDYLSEPLEIVQQSIQFNRCSNVICKMLNWNNLSTDLQTDVLILSDINYNPKDFNQLQKVIHRFLEQGTTIILSTPQRIAGKSFITPLLPFCKESVTISVPDNQAQTAVSVFVL